MKPAVRVSKHGRLKSLSVSTVLFVCAACQTLEGDLGPQGTALPAGSTLRLLVPVEVPANRARVGLPVKEDSGAEPGYEVRCLLEVENVGEVSQEVPAGDYRVEKAEIERTYFVDDDPLPYLVASADLLLASERATPMYRVTNVFLEPGQAADLRRLACSRLGSDGANYVTIAEMGVLLSGVIEFEAAAAAR